MWILRALLLAVLPTSIARMLVPSLRRTIAPSARVGFSLVRVSGAMSLAEGARIGHLNVIHVNELTLGPRSRIGHLNRIGGPFRVRLDVHAEIGNTNIVNRGRAGQTTVSTLALGEWAKITADHRVNMASDVIIGQFSTIAGAGSQIWTHGYVHETEGLGRYRIDGPVVIGDNVYIGSMCFLSMGITIARGVIVGGGTSVARDLTEPGLYVSAGLRQLPRPPEPGTRADLEVLEDGSGEIAFRKITGPANR